MSSSNSTIDEINAITNSSIIFTRTWCFLMFSLGVIGHTCNIYIFTRPIFRVNPCARYFFASAISGCLVVFMNIPVRLLQAGYNLNIVTQSAIACKMITFILFWARAQPSWFIVLASIDRFLHSSQSARLRGWSCVAVTRRTIPLTSFILLLAYAHVPIYHVINVQQRLCFPMTGVYQKFFGIWNLIVFSVGPPSIMLLFGLLTIRHVRQSMNRIAATNDQITTSIPSRPRRKTTDRHLIRMLLVQCFMFTLTASPTSIQYIYTSVRETMIVDNLQKAKDNFFYIIAGFVSLTVPCTSFYIFTLSSKLFRHELSRLFIKQTQILPLTRSLNQNTGPRS